MRCFTPNLFHQLSIRSKLIVYLMATSLSAILIISILFSLLINQQLRETYFHNLNNLLSILSRNAQASLLFDVSKDATDLLSSLKARNSAVAAYMYTKNGDLFASYETDTIPNAPDQLRTIEYLNNSSSYYRTEQAIQLDDGEQLGRLVMYDNLQPIRQNRRNTFLLLGAAASTAFITTLILAHFLRGLISRPLSDLTNMVEKFTWENRSSQIAQTTSARSTRQPKKDEIVLLTQAFSSMREELRSSYAQLEQYNQTLEKMVYSKTQELRKVLRNLQESQAQLIQSEKMAALGHLVAGVAHEINNNINFVSNALPLLEQRLGLPSQETPAASKAQEIPLSALIGNAKEGIQRTQKIIADLTMFARPSKGTISYTDIHNELHAVLNLLHYDLHDRIEVNLNLCREMPFVPCVRDQMNQVYMNILLNAIQACGESGTIQITTSHDAASARIQIQDSGPGIPAEIVSEIFDPFFTTKEVGKGTGLGLSISYAIVQKHQGTLTAESGQEKGAQFTITLPLSAKTLGEDKHYV